MSARARVEALLALRERFATPEADLGARFVARIVARGILSEAGARLALTHLEPPPSAAELASLLGSVRRAPRCAVSLSANVSVAAFRALALALASAPIVTLKPSRRDPVLADLLIDAYAEVAPPGTSLSRVDAITAAPGDHVMAYGADATLAAIRGALSPGVTFDAHGTGFGVALIGVADHLSEVARALAGDVIVFDQQGCLSPRIAFVEGEAERARRFAEHLCEALSTLGHAIPPGPAARHDAADVLAYKRLMRAAGDVLEGEGAAVGVDLAPRALTLPPPTRIVHVVSASPPRALELVTPVARFVTAVGATDPVAATFEGRLTAPRVSPPGRMQRPPLDGPVDRRLPLVGAEGSE